MITQDIKNKIAEEANWRSTNGHGGVDDITRDNFILAAEYGYSLAQQEIVELKKNNQGLHDTLQARISVGVKDFEQIQEQDKEIKRLRGLIQMIYKQNPFTDEISWQQFKTENNL